MSARWTIPVISAFFAGLVAFAVAHHTVRDSDDHVLGHLHNLDYLTRALNLDAVQVGEVAALHEALNARLKEACIHHCAARVDLGEALIDDLIGDSEIETLLQDMGRAYLESERVVLEHIRDMNALLRPEQRERFSRMIRDTFCRACPVCRTGAHRNDKVFRIMISAVNAHGGCTVEGNRR